MRLVPENWVEQFLQEGTSNQGNKQNEISQKSSALIKKLRPRLDMTSSGNIMYPDGTIGSQLETLVEYAVAPQKTIDRPIDSDKFVEYLQSLNLKIPEIDKRFHILFDHHSNINMRKNVAWEKY